MIKEMIVWLYIGNNLVLSEHVMKVNIVHEDITIYVFNP